MFPCVNICLPDNVLDPVDPRLDFSTLEYGHRRGMWTREAEMWSTNFTYCPMRPPHFFLGKRIVIYVSINHSTNPAFNPSVANVWVMDNALHRNCLVFSTDVAVLVPTMTSNLPSDTSSIFEDSRKLCCRPAHNLEEGNGFMRPFS